MIRAFRIGLRDGLARPFDLSAGISWGDDRDIAYDHGVNTGQWRAAGTESEAYRCGYLDQYGLGSEAHVHTYTFNRYCGAHICGDCDDHKGLDRCDCGWSRYGQDGRRELIEMGETIDEEDY